MSFEKLRVYQAAELLDAEVTALIKTIPRGFARDLDQLNRACASIPYNIAEAYGSLLPGRRIYFLDISRGSADEARAVLRRISARGGLGSKAIVRPSNLARAVEDADLVGYRARRSNMTLWRITQASTYRIKKHSQISQSGTYRNWTWLSVAVRCSRHGTAFTCRCLVPQLEPRSHVTQQNFRQLCPEVAVLRRLVPQ